MNVIYTRLGLVLFCIRMLCCLLHTAHSDDKTDRNIATAETFDVPEF